MVMRKQFLGLIVIGLVLMSCNHTLFGTPDRIGKTLSPGECLSDTTLNLHYIIPRDNEIEFDFDLNLKDIKYDSYKKSAIRYMPDDVAYTPFGNNASSVKSEFDHIFYEIEPNTPDRMSLCTILYNGGLSLTANKEFAGYKPGENLAPLLYIWVQDYQKYDFINSYFNIPVKYDFMLQTHFGFSMPLEKYKKVEDSVIFELKLPVKVIMYLNWLNDKLSDPEAPVSYNDETLYCKFSTDFTLR